MFQFAAFSDYPSYLLIWVAAALIVGGAIVGHLTDAVMGEHGFGVFGNAVLAILGAFVGIYVRTTFFGRLYGEDLMATGFVAAAAATILLLLLGFAKHLIQD